MEENMKFLIVYGLIQLTSIVSFGFDIKESKTFHVDDYRLLVDGKLEEAAKVTLKSNQDGNDNQKLILAKRIFDLRVAQRLCEYSVRDSHNLPSACGKAFETEQDFAKSYLCSFAKSSAFKEDCELEQKQYIEFRIKIQNSVSKMSRLKSAQRYIRASNELPGSNKKQVIPPSAMGAK